MPDTVRQPMRLDARVIPPFERAPTVKIADRLAWFTVRERVRWSDVDAAGIVCYGSYLRFFELAESEMFRAAGLPARTLSETHGLWLVRRRVECDFFHPISLDEEMEVAVSVGVTGHSSLELLFRVEHLPTRTLAAEGRYVLVAVDRAALSPVALPAEVRAGLRPYRLDRAR